MGMSKIRSEIEVETGELSLPELRDMAAFAIFTQKRAGAAFVFAGFVDAGDAELALAFGREHYGQDQECVCMWAFAERAIVGSRADYPSAEAASGAIDGTVEDYQIFTQVKAGEWHVSGPVVEAGSGAAAVNAFAATNGGVFHSLWAVPGRLIFATEKDDLIWRYTNQDYRLARGYAKDVREKWEAVRVERDVDDYQKDDLKETF